METSQLRLVHEARGGDEAPSSALSEDLVFHHPFLNGAVRGRDHFARLWTELERSAGPVVFSQRVSGR